MTISRRSALVLLVLAAFVAGSVLFASVAFLVAGRAPAPVAMQSSVGGPFTLIDHDGRTFTDGDLKGQPFLAFFGFTHCPDVCPATLFEVSEILRALGDDRVRVRAVFVTVDPERDTAEKLKDYLSSFDPRVVGLTGDDAAIGAVVRNYKVYAKKVALDGGGYVMDHTAIVYLMDKEGRFVAPFDMKRRPAEAAAELRRHL